MRPIMDPRKGTPKTLDECLRNALEWIEADHYELLPPNAHEIIRTHIKDYLAQKFTLMLHRKYTKEQTNASFELWEMVVQPEPEPLPEPPMDLGVEPVTETVDNETLDRLVLEAMNLKKEAV